MQWTQQTPHEKVGFYWWREERNSHVWLAIIDVCNGAPTRVNLFDEYFGLTGSRESSLLLEEIGGWWLQIDKPA